MTTFLDALAPELRDRYAAYPELAPLLDRLVAEARPLPAADFLPYLAARAGDDPAALATVRAADLALAAACTVGGNAALARFEAEHFGQVDAALAGFRNVSITRDELRQAMRDRLFVATTGAPRIAGYQGRGELRSWVRMAATRYLIDHTRADSARPDKLASDAQLAEAAAATADPVLAFLKDKYRGEFRAAFAAALATLPPEERNMLRLRYLEGLDVAEVATIFGVHRVTLSRSLTRVRDSLFAAIRTELMKRLQISRDEFDSIMTLINSQLDVSLGGLLESR